jgi:hypothetical protein
MVNAAEEFQVRLVRRASEGAGADLISAVAVSTWRGIDAALSPIIGRGGVSALFERSLYLSSARQPALIAGHDDALLSGNFTGLGSALTGASAGEAALAHGALIGCFYGLLAGLIGNPLTDRLLQPVWDSLDRGDPAKDDTP